MRALIGPIIVTDLQRNICTRQFYTYGIRLLHTCAVAGYYLENNVEYQASSL